jgi:hypothetical protein
MGDKGTSYNDEGQHSTGFLGVLLRRKHGHSAMPAHGYKMLPSEAKARLSLRLFGATGVASRHFVPVPMSLSAGSQVVPFQSINEPLCGGQHYLRVGEIHRSLAQRWSASAPKTALSPSKVLLEKASSVTIVFACAVLLNGKP